MCPDEEQEETRQQMDALIERTATGLCAAGDDRAAIIAVIRPFLANGMEIVGSPSALWGYFDTVLRRAGFNATQQDWRLRIYSTVTQEVFGGGRPYPPDWPWHEQT